MRTVYIGFSRPRNKLAVLSYLIRLIEGTKYSHTFLEFRLNNLEEDIIYHASGMSVNAYSKAYFQDKTVIIHKFELSLSEEMHTKLLKNCVSKLGAPYSFKQLLGILIYKVTGNSKIILDGRKAYVCSELIAELLTEIFGNDFDKDLDVVTPKDIYELLKEKYNGQT